MISSGALHGFGGKNCAGVLPASECTDAEGSTNHFCFLSVQHIPLTKRLP